MAIFRKVHTSIWSDSFFSNLDKDRKLFYLYLLTNDKTRQCGIYEITKKHISYDTGYSIDTVSKQLEYFIKSGKIRYNESTNELAIGNWLKYNSSTSPKVKTCIDKEFLHVKDTVLIEYVKSMDTRSQEEQEEEQEEEKNKIEGRKLKFALTIKPFAEKYGKDMCNAFYKYWTEPNKSGTKFRQESEKNWELSLRLARWAQNDKNYNKEKPGFNSIPNAIV
jgi:hypothetical protein